MALPFDVHSEELMRQFLLYADEAFTLKAGSLSKPELTGPALSAYEIYYQKIGLYYSFSKALGLELDERWVYAAREETTGEINRLLVRL
jgi:ATP-dependent RNA helicase SUPV3L1/SUV3